MCVSVCVSVRLNETGKTRTMLTDFPCALSCFWAKRRGGGVSDCGCAFEKKEARPDSVR